MPFVVDEHPVGALGSCGAYPSLGVTVRAGSTAGLYYLQAPAGEDPGQTQTVTFTLGPANLGFYNNQDSSPAGLHDQFTVR